MAIRIRRVNGVLIAICAAKSIPKEGDVYLDDAQHEALSAKFRRDYHEMFNITIYGNENAELVEQEESNNKNAEWWNKTYKENL